MIPYFRVIAFSYWRDLSCFKKSAHWVVPHLLYTCTINRRRRTLLILVIVTYYGFTYVPKFQSIRIQTYCTYVGISQKKMFTFNGWFTACTYISMQPVLRSEHLGNLPLKCYWSWTFWITFTAMSMEQLRTELMLGSYFLIHLAAVSAHSIIHVYINYLVIHLGTYICTSTFVSYVLSAWKTPSVKPRFCSAWQWLINQRHCYVLLLLHHAKSNDNLRRHIYDVIIVDQITNNMKLIQFFLSFANC